MKRALALLLVVACGSPAAIRLTEVWNSGPPPAYDEITAAWTRHNTLRGQYQEALDVSATFKSPDWRSAHAARDADNRQLTGAARDAVFAQAKADMAGPYEVEMLVTTWDRRENDLDHGQKSVWRVVLITDDGKEIEPIEIVRDKRPTFTLRAEFPALGDFAVAYIARFPRTVPILGPTVHAIRLRMSSERGGVELAWVAP